MRSFRLPLLLLIVGIVAIALVVAQLVAPRVNDRLDAGRSYVEVHHRVEIQVGNLQRILERAAQQ